MEEKLHEIQKTPLMLENAPKEKPPKKKKFLNGLLTQIN